MLNKSRLENLSDGVFAIVLTLLVFNIQIPAITGSLTNAAFLTVLSELVPVLIQFLISFIVLTLFWLGHNFFYSAFVLDINRPLVLLNLLYLGLISLIPFSAHVLGTYLHIPFAVMLFGINVLLIGLLNIYILHYALASHEIDTEHIEPRLIKQASIRQYITAGSTAFGIIIAYFSVTFALVFYTLPVLFNIIPGSLDRLEKLFGFRLD